MGEYYHPLNKRILSNFCDIFQPEGVVQVGEHLPSKQ
jgi:hypothetical protein